MIILNKNSGFTLVETIIYIALFGIIMGGAVVTTYQLMIGSNDIGYRTEIDQEASFLLAKIDWALTGAKATAITVPGPTTLTITTPAITFELNGTNLTLNGETLNSDSVKVEAVGTSPVFEKIPLGGQTLIKTTFTLDGRTYRATKYLRP